MISMIRYYALFTLWMIFSIIVIIFTFSFLIDKIGKTNALIFLSIITTRYLYIEFIENCHIKKEYFKLINLIRVPTGENCVKMAFFLIFWSIMLFLLILKS